MSQKSTKQNKTNDCVLQQSIYGQKCVDHSKRSKVKKKILHDNLQQIL